MEKTILIADDDPLNLDIMAGVLGTLRGLTPRVLTAIDGIQALRMIEQERPDLVLLDAEMPGLTGWEICRRVKADPVLASIPVFMVTANLREEKRREAIEAGVDDYILKPFDVQDLRGRVLDVLNAGAEQSTG